MTEKTSKEAASAAARVLRDPNASEDAKTAAGSALTQREVFVPVREGLSLRDHFAGLAMQALIVRGYDVNNEDQSNTAYVAYGMADDMLEARKEE